jgi:hypothetical protein
VTVTTLAAGTTTYTSETTVAFGDTLRFPPGSSATLVMDNKNLIIEGTLEMKPSGPNIVHLLQFINVNEANFVGGAVGGMGTPLATDVGLWVMNDGILDAIGSPKVGWNRTGDDATWESTDEMYTTPWAEGDYTTYAAHTKGGSLQSFVGPTGETHTQEAFNLTRNVRIEGTPGHNTHIFIRTDVAQTIKYVQLRHVGPRTPTGDSAISAVIRGRWGMHLHHLMDAGYDTLIEGCVVRDNPSHAFVVHGTNGATIRDCVAFNTNHDAFWWDAEVTSDASFDVTYDHCLVAKVVPIPAFRGFNMAGIVASHGSGTMTDCCVVGNVANKNSSGYRWPEDAGFDLRETAHGIWENTGNVAHNNKWNGLYYWQNDNKPEHHIQYFTAFRNGQHGIVHGAYANIVRYDNLTLFENGATDLLVLANNIESEETGDIAMSFHDVYTDLLFFGEHVIRSLQPTRLFDSTFTSAIIDETPTSQPLSETGVSEFDLINTDLEPGDWTVIAIGPLSRYRVQRSDGTAYQFTDAGYSVIAAFDGLTGTGAFAPPGVTLAGTGTTDISHGAFAAVKPALAGTGAHQIQVGGSGAVAMRAAAFAGTGTGSATEEGHVEGGIAALSGLGFASPSAVISARGGVPMRVRG